MPLFTGLFLCLFISFYSSLNAAVPPIVNVKVVGVHNLITTRNGPNIQRERFPISLHQITPTSPSQVAGISRSRLGYSQTTGVAGGIVIPGQRGVEYSFYIEGSISLNGTLSSEVQDITDNLVLQFSSEFQEWYKDETKSLKSRAGGGFFNFFQAAANYGYTKNKRTQDILESDEFRRFSDKAGGTLKSVTPQVLSGKFGGSYKAVSVGKREVVTIFAYIFLNQITLESGEIFNVVSKSTSLAMADQNGNIVNDDSTIDINPGPKIDDNVIDTTIGGP